MPEGATQTEDLEAIEIELFLEGVRQRYGYDFRDYAKASLRRRIRKVMAAEGLPTVTRLQDRVLHDPAALERFMLAVSIHVTAMFRDPSFFLAFRNEVVPLLRTYPSVRIWHAGCSSGEEVYSLAIVLEEEGLYNRSRIYATDINDVVLKKAKAGIFPLSEMQDYTRNYLAAGGNREFSTYYTADRENAVFRASLKKSLIFSQHNLVHDGSFNEFNVILCRNVMIYFNKELQDRVHGLFYDSLCRFGILALGKKESLNLAELAGRYEVLVRNESLFRRVG